MGTVRAYVYKTARTPKPLAALECASVTNVEAKIAAQVNLQSLKPGMLFRLAKGREGNVASTRVIKRVEQKKTGQSTIFFSVQTTTANK